VNPPAARTSRLLPVIAVLLASCSTVPPSEFSSGEKTYLNPVLERDFPDPAVLRDADGWFYAYATQSEAAGRILNVQVARSRDLVRWEHLGDALPEKPRWAAGKQNFWAPHVIYDGARSTYVMYFSAEPDSGNGKCLAVATSAGPAGPFADTGKPLLCGGGVEHIDPMAFDDPRTSKRLLYWGSGSTPIRVRELTPDRLDFLPGSAAVNLIFPDAQSRYRALIEGAWVIHRDGSYYLFFSGDRCCGPKADYALMVSRARDAFGPFEALAGPILEENAVWRAPGHGSVVTDGAGDDWIVYHAVSTTLFRSMDRAGGGVTPRAMLLDRVVYHDGWPRIAGDQPSVTRQRAPLAGGR
jgi:arabinan endo-1,5-alpha-L-arabinosidase